MRCEICGCREVGRHHCSRRALLRVEAQYRRQESIADGEESEEPTFEERLEVGFEMMAGTLP